MPANQEQIQSLLFAYEFGDLTPDEHDTLMQAALEDPAIFEQVWHATRHREFLNQGNDRQRLAALCIAPAQRSFWARYRWLVLASTAAVLLLVATIVWQARRAPSDADLQSASGGTVTAAVVSQLFTANLPPADPATIQLLAADAASRASGLVRFQLKLSPSQSLIVLRKQPGLAPELVWPTTLAQSPIPAAADQILTLDWRNPTASSSGPGSEFRFLLAPANLDLRTRPSALGEVPGQVTALSFQFATQP